MGKDASESIGQSPDLWLWHPDAFCTVPFVSELGPNAYQINSDRRRRSFAAMPAAAIVKITTYSGTVVGYDQTGVAPHRAATCTGYNWVATYTYRQDAGQQ